MWVDSAVEVMYNQAYENVEVWTFGCGGGWNQMGSYPRSMTNGDQLCAVARADGQLQVYVNSSLLTSVDITGWACYASGGYIGLETDSPADARLDNFGGGTAAAGITPGIGTPTPGIILSGTRIRQAKDLVVMIPIFLNARRVYPTLQKIIKKIS